MYILLWNVLTNFYYSDLIRYFPAQGWKTSAEPPPSLQALLSAPPYPPTFQILVYPEDSCAEFWSKTISTFFTFPCTSLVRSFSMSVDFYTSTEQEERYALPCVIDNMANKPQLNPLISQFHWMIT